MNLTYVPVAAALAAAVPVPTVDFLGGCYPDDNLTQHVFVDVSATSQPALETGLSWLATASSVLWAQTHVALVPRTQRLSGPAPCDGLLAVTSMTEVSNGGMHLLFDDRCTDVAEGGIAYVGGVCVPPFHRGVLFTRVANWATLLHEVGHLLGAVHPFETTEAAPGATGGVMDYGSKEHDGTIQFHPDMAASLCRGLRSATCRFPVAAPPVVASQSHPHDPYEYRTHRHGYASSWLWGLLLLLLLVATIAGVWYAALGGCAPVEADRQYLQ